MSDLIAPESEKDVTPDTETSKNDDGADVPAATRASLRIRTRGKRKRYSDDFEEGEELENLTKPSHADMMMKSASSEPPKQPTPVAKKKAPTPVAAKAPKQPRRGKTTEMETDLVQKEMFYEFTNIDVLFGRGNHVNKLPGNLRFRRKVHPFRVPYNATKDAGEKRVVLYKAYEAVRENGARFMDILEWIPGTETGEGVFRSAPLARALEKVAQALREPKWTPPPPEENDSMVYSYRKKKASPEQNDDSSAATRDTKASTPPVPQEKQPEQLPVNYKEGEEQPEKSPVNHKEGETPHFKHVLLFNAEVEPEEEDEEKSVENEMPKPEETHHTTAVKSEKKKGKKLSAMPASGATKKPARKRAYQRDDEDSFGELLGLDELGEKNVLFGRGHHINANPGNVEFRRVIKQNKPAYAKLALTSKRPMAIEIYNQFGGMFLEAVSGTNANGERLLFRKVKLERCIEKICQALREKYSYVIPEPGNNKKKLSNISSSDSSTDNDEDGKSNAKIRLEPPTKKLKSGETKKLKSGEGTQRGEEPRGLEDNTGPILGIGSRIAVYWPIDKASYEAVVEKRKPREGFVYPDGRESKTSGMMYYIRYTLDGESEWIDLKEHQYTIVSVVPEKESPKAGQVVQIMRSGHVKRHIARRTLFWQEANVASSSGTAPAKS